MTRHTTSSVLALLLFSSLATAQKPPPAALDDFGIFSTQEEYGQFMGMVKSDPDLSPMVDIINDVVLGQPIGSTGQRFDAHSSQSGLLSNAKVREAIEMADFQFEEFQELSREIHQEAASKLREINFSDRRQAIEQVRRIRDETEQQLTELLLPHQRQRLQQLDRQYRLRGKSLAEAITSEPLKTQLKIDEQQKGELIEAERKIQEELQRKIAKLRAEARQEFVSKLNAKQRAQVEELFGDRFEYGEATRRGSQRQASKRK